MYGKQSRYKDSAALWMNERNACSAINAHVLNLT